MKVFISCPFTGLCDEKKYEVKDEYKDFFNKLTSALESIGCEYYLAVKDSDILVVIPGNKISKGISGGVHVELGWASALDKKMHILIDDDYTYSPVLLGLNVLTPTQYHTCNKFLDNEMLEKIIDIVKHELSVKEGN